MWKTFWLNFRGDAVSIGSWYRNVLGSAFRRILPALFFMLLIAGASIWMSYDWINQNVAEVIAKASPEDLAKVEQRVRDLPDLAEIRDNISAPFLFLNNTRAVALIFLVGLVSFSVLGILLYMINIGLIGGIFAILQLLGIQPWPIFIAGVVPHGVFQIPAIMIGSAVV